jgi:signal transduction histidine kinase
VEASCLECHRQYRIGDIRGAISVSIPVNYVFQNISRNRWILAAGAFLISMSLLLFLYLSMKRLVIKPIKTLKETMKNYKEGMEVELEKPVTEELKSLYSTFSEMMNTIRKYHDSLEEEVKKATEELRTTNEKLIRVSQQYKALSARKSDFISAISHELRTPLTSIKGSISYIQQRLLGLREDCPKRCDIQDVLSFMEIISSNAERLNRMVSETLDLEKIENGKMEFHFERLYLDRILKNLTMEVMPLLDEKRLSLKTEIEENLPIWADEDRIRQVILNFVTNAIQYSPEGDRIILEAYRTGDWVVLRIKDNGPGIPYEKQERIFERFYKERKGGTGLGLAISRAIIKAHEGEIGVISNGKKGSTFYFKLPLHEGGDNAFSSDS